MKAIARIAAILVASSLLSGCFVGNPSAKDRLDPRKVSLAGPNLTLDYGPDPAQVLDVYRPAGWQPSDARPTIVFVHGGGWVSGKRGDLSPSIKAQLSRGWVVISIDYRLSDRVDWPSPVQDVDRAIRFVRSNAGLLGVDANVIVTSGHSAGAHLVLAQALGAGNSSFTAPDLQIGRAHV